MEIHRALLDIFGIGDKKVPTSHSGVWRPSWCTTFDSAGIVLDVDMPGVSPSDITVWVTLSKVIVKGTRFGTLFTHTYTLTGDYDTTTAEATMADNTLRVRVARFSSRSPRRVPIEFATR